MIRIGITGGIGSGKSVVSSLLEVAGVPVYIADTESKLLTNTSPTIHKQLTALLGDDLFAGGELNKQRLASVIFNDQEMLKQVNVIIHPEVNHHFSDWVTRQTTKLCALESAILFESGFNQAVDVTVMVYAPLELRLTRVAARDGASIDSIRSRINSQLPDETKMQKADYTIYNDNRQALIPQVQTFLNQIL